MGNINSFKIKLNKRIVVEEPIKTTDNAGGFDINWSLIGSFWSEIKPASIKEENFADKKQKVITHEITIRYNSVIKDNMRIIFDGRIFEIVAVVNLMEKGEFLQILVREEK